MTTTPDFGGLTKPQIIALDALVRGMSITEAADAAGVHRCTIHTWCRGHKDFRGALNETRQSTPRSCSITTGAWSNRSPAPSAN